MRVIKILVFCFIFYILFSSPVYSENNYKWRKVGSLDCNRIESFAFNSRGEILTSSFSRPDSGVGWSRKASYSTDDGNTWKDVLSTGWRSVYIAVNSEDHIYAGTWGKVQKSTDDGKNWHTTDETLPISAIHTLDFNPEGYIYLGANNANYRSKDGGYAWTKLNLDHQAKSYLFKADGTIFASVASGIYPDPKRYIYRSTDNGETWNMLISSTKSSYWLIALSKKGHLFAAVNSSESDYGSVIRSDDNGDSWYSINNNLPKSDINDFIKVPFYSFCKKIISLRVKMSVEIPTIAFELVLRKFFNIFIIVKQVNNWNGFFLFQFINYRQIIIFPVIIENN